MKKLSKTYLLLIIGVVIGTTASYFYWKLVGCNSGTCAITSNPTNSTLYGAVIGGLLFPVFQPKKK